jgi:hypothetical protein
MRRFDLLALRRFPSIACKPFGRLGLAALFASFSSLLRRGIELTFDVVRRRVIAS